MRSTAETFAARSRFAKFSLKGNAMQQVMLALSIATFEGYLAEIYEVGRQILTAEHTKKGVVSHWNRHFFWHQFHAA